MNKELSIIGFGLLPCLNCGEVVNMGKDIHCCNKPKEEWLMKQDKVVMEMPDGMLWDLKNRKIIK